MIHISRGTRLQYVTSKFWIVLTGHERCVLTWKARVVCKVDLRAYGYTFALCINIHIVTYRHCYEGFTGH